MSVPTAHILLVEDSPGDAHLIQELLRKAKLQAFDIECAGNLAKALQRLGARQFDAVLLDLSLPDSEGRETFARVQAEAPDVPIVILTGLDDEDTAVQTVGAGAQDYLVKGQVQGPLLVRAVRYAIERHRAEKELHEREERYRSVVTAMAEGVVFQDANGVIRTCNASAERILGLASDQILGSTSSDPHWQAIHEDGSPFPGETHPAMATLRSGQPCSNVVMGVHKPDGSLTWISINSEPLFQPGATRPDAVVTSFTEITELKRAEQKLQQLNAELEQRVRERTAELEAVNKELQTFCYAVSHDLQAPLRAIDGFSALLLGHKAEQLDTQGQHYLQRVREGAHHMAQLIEALLGLSRVTRTELQWQEVDLSALAETVAAELQRESNRSVQFVIAPQVRARGDLQLLRMVLNNLLGNAWKYTRKHATARIEFGCTVKEGQPVYLVRDDGAGFDMAYVGKLFGAFQRLHSTDDFEGTGIGLATVQRIIHRHGGRVWAEGAVEQGATFYFTLSPAV